MCLRAPEGRNRSLLGDLVGTRGIGNDESTGGELMLEGEWIMNGSRVRGVEEDELDFYFNLNWDWKNWLLNRLRVKEIVSRSERRGIEGFLKKKLQNCNFF